MVHHCHGQGGADVDYGVAGCCSAYLEGGEVDNWIQLENNSPVIIIIMWYI